MWIIPFSKSSSAKAIWGKKEINLQTCIFFVSKTFKSSVSDERNLLCLEQNHTASFPRSQTQDTNGLETRRHLCAKEDKKWGRCLQNVDELSDQGFYLCLDFETLELLFVINSGVLCCVVKVNRVSITAQPGEGIFCKPNFSLNIKVFLACIQVTWHTLLEEFWFGSVSSVVLPHFWPVPPPI